MAVSKNLLIVPALKIDDGAPGAPWSGPGAGDWARTPGAHASLPRSTGYAGTTVGNVILSRANVTAGKYYVVSYSVRAIAPQAAVLNLDWKTGSNVFVSTTSGAGSDYGVISLSGNSTGRFAVIGQCPATATRLTPVAVGMDGSAQITAGMVREFATLLDAQAAILVDRLASGYFDGDTAGAVWDGADGESTSTLTADPIPTALTSWGAQTTTVNRTRDFGTAATIWGAQTTRTGLIPSVTWDPRRGRYRISATGLGADVVRVEVSSRTLGTSRWAPVRGGSVSVTDGRFARTVDDYEFSAGEGMQYRIQTITTAENILPVNISQTSVITVGDTLDQVWIKFIVAPHRNAKVSLIGWGRVTRRSRQAVFGVRNRPDPIVVTDVHQSRVVEIQIMTWSEEEATELDQALALGLPVYLHTPSSVQLASMYASVGDYGYERSGGVLSPRNIFTIPLTEVSAPPLSIVGPGLTYLSLLEDFATYEELAAAYATYLEVLA